MVRWEAVCRPMELGGLGIPNTRIFNECMSTKWIWKRHQHKDSLRVRILRTKYMRHGDFFRSQFWKSLHKVKYLFKWGVVHSMGNRWCTKFWDDVWLANTPLRI
jgi:uncharacterized protein YdiU (UPF0061 family)